MATWKSFVGSNTRPSDAPRETSGLRVGLLDVMLATPPAHSLCSTMSARAASSALFGSQSGNASDWTLCSVAKVSACKHRFGLVTSYWEEKFVEVELSV